MMAPGPAIRGRGRAHDSDENTAPASTASTEKCPRCGERLSVQDLVMPRTMCWDELVPPLGDTEK
jgi:hypothetical protein